jgi:lysophospholipase L1-like esterase
MSLRAWLLSLILLIPGLLVAQAVTPAERARFEEIRARHDRGDNISPEDRQFAQGIMARMSQTNAAQQNTQWAAGHPPRDFTGMVPLPDLAGGSYQGEQGGLYPGGGNTPPEAHLAEGLKRSRRITPLDAVGAPSSGGRIVFLTIGMSNTTQETQAFLRLAAADREVNPSVTLVDGAQGAQVARITADPKANFWNVVAERLAAAKVTAKQVQVVWIKQANPQPDTGWPAATKQLQADLVSTIHNLHDRYPNLKIAYLSSRIYGGYAATPLNPEPYAYEGGFAVKWTIAAQIAGDSALARDRAPWLAWGPYLWADGVKGRKQDSLVWTRDDLGPDGTHPSDSGRQKVGQLLLDFLKTDPTARGWFTRSVHE